MKTEKCKHLRIKKNRQGMYHTSGQSLMDVSLFGMNVWVAEQFGIQKKISKTINHKGANNDSSI
jgi:hypothetical protein